jgi:hypothetical protein
MAELLGFARQYTAELCGVLPDGLSSIEPIRLMQEFLKLVYSNPNAIHDVDLMDGFLNICEACKEYEKKHSQDIGDDLLKVLKIQLACNKFLADAERNTHFLNRHPWKIIIGFSLLCMMVGILLTATGVGSPLVLLVGLLGTSLTMALPALLSVTSLFCFAVGFVTSGIVVGLGQLLHYCLPKTQSSLPSHDYASNTAPAPKQPVIASSSNEKQTVVRSIAYDTFHDALHHAFFPFLNPPFGLDDYQILKQGLTYRLENTYGHGAIEYYLIEELNNAKKMIDKDDRFEELCRICGVAVARVDDSVWNNWNKYYQDHRDQQEQEEQQKDKPSVTPVVGEVARFIVLEGKNPYEILGVSRHATYVEIKKAFHKNALTCHPDKVGEEGIEAFKEVNTAYGFLSAKDKREEVDELLVQANKNDAQGMVANYY